MSSSKIIKFQEYSDVNMTQFAFQAIGHNIAMAPPTVKGGEFVPTNIVSVFDEGDEFNAMTLFNNAVEAEGNLCLTPAEVLEPTGILLTEEELEIKLRESFESGLQDGKNLAERGLINVFNSLRSASEGLHAMRERILRESEDELLKLIMMVARKVILREINQDSRILMTVVQAAISKVSERDEIVIHLNPDDYTRVTTHREDYFSEELITERMRFKPNSLLLPGCCQIYTEMGTIDAGFDAQLDEIYRHLLEERNASL